MDSEMAINGGQNLLQPFLKKCYDIVDDPATDSIVSWSTANNSFVIWDLHAFSKILPKYFKHDNFSSFVRQLNVYGFHKVDPDRWEFANERFLRDQKHLLKNIARKKSSSCTIQQQQQPQRKESIEVEHLGLKDEIDILRRDKNLLMQELIKLDQQQQNSDVELHALMQRIQDMELNQQQMMSFLAIAVQSPATLAELVKQSCNSWWRTEMSKVKQLPSPNQTVTAISEASADWQIISYQPPTAVEAEIQPCLPETFRTVASKCSTINGFDSCKDTADMAVEANSILISEEDVAMADYLEYLLSSPAR